MPQVDTDGNHGLFLHEQLAHAGNKHKKVLNIASNEDIMENNHMFAMLWNISVVSHQSMAIKRILKINHSWTELFNFQNSFNCH